MKHPDEEITQAFREQMNGLAMALDKTFNGTKRGTDRTVCFTLLITEFNEPGREPGRVNYISNGERADIVNMLKEILARFEGQPEMKGTA